ncbi:phosphatase PAP2 family protein [Larsenimonas suaedae]|uniref:undecaprenyl-diphosphate phosphatase n=1 Tax=Larsenimonas suaedae TaxID=1851019 RepID=A0ABU1GRW7_9GAMM|nr:phosphatase PAP2 family protein [Larsenimonas suaedae]MCM2972475.1 phosphatase PAP2 family protein [Larsenimonas suaedae]MDR5894729.1 phosphatase PAP2 family protein [Larsenimonas suaedae]
MEALNLRLFDRLNAPAHASQFLLMTADVFAIYVIYLVPLLLALGWLHKDPDRQRGVLQALVACVVALGVNGVIGLFWDHPRPFVAHLGHTYLAHSATPSFPSDHMTIVTTVALTFLAYLRLRRIGAALGLLSLGIAWSRIYLGVHYPMDMLGAIGVSVLCTLMARRLEALYMPGLHRLTRRVYRRLFSVFIARGWLAR